MADGVSRNDTPDVEKDETIPTQQESTVRGNPAHEFSEGGFKGWLTVAGTWAVMFITFGYVNCFG
jgi:hypothetical protein